MTRWVDDKLARLRALYPEERVRRSRARWEAVWRGDWAALDRYPFVLAPLQADYYAVGQTPAQRLRHLLDEHIAHGRLEDDAIPTLFPGCNQAVMPNLFGAPAERFARERKARPIIDGRAAARALAAPVLGPEARHWLAMLRYFRERVGDTIPLRVADMQGPLDAAAQLWSYEALFICCHEDPATYDHLMNRLVEAFLLLWEAQAAVAGDALHPSHLNVWSWMPLPRAVTLSMDSLVMMSPAFCRRWCLPALQRIAARFPDGMVIHSCGDVRQHRELLQGTPFIRGIHFGQMTLEQVVEAGFDASTVLLAGTHYANRAGAFQAIRNGRLRVDLTFSGAAPAEPPSTWRSADWQTLAERCRDIAGLAAETAAALRTHP